MSFLQVFHSRYIFFVLLGLRTLAVVTFNELIGVTGSPLATPVFWLNIYNGYMQYIHTGEMKSILILKLYALQTESLRYILILILKLVKFYNFSGEQTSEVKWMSWFISLFYLTQ